MKKSEIKIGDVITCKEAVKGYSRSSWRYGIKGDRFGEYPMFNPGMKGFVYAINVPSVCREKVSFVCVEFTNQYGEKDTTGILYSNIEKIS